MCQTTPLPELAELSGRLCGRLARAWPKASPQAVEDAVQDALLILWLRTRRAAVERPESFAWRVAWRRLRAGWRRPRPLPELREHAGGDPWGGVELGLDVERCLRRRPNQARRSEQHRWLVERTRWRERWHQRCGWFERRHERSGTTWHRAHLGRRRLRRARQQRLRDSGPVLCVQRL